MPQGRAGCMGRPVFPGVRGGGESHRFADKQGLIDLMGECKLLPSGPHL